MPTVDLTGARWRKSSRSTANGSDGNCVEVAFDGAATALRDSKNSRGPVLVVPVKQWHDLLAALPRL